MSPSRRSTAPFADPSAPARGSGPASRPGAGRSGEAPSSASPAKSTFRLQDVRYAYPGRVRPAVEGVDLELGGGRHTCIVGPNGAGKSTLLRLMLGLLTPDRGRVLLWGRPVAEWSRRALARRAGVVAQEPPPRFPMPVREFVEMGRHPHLRPWQRLGPADRRAVERALARTALTELADRPISALSGGELQRTKLARALAQEPRLLLLDEPTAHLDLGHGVRIFGLVDRLVREEGLSAVTVTHDLGLAGRFADRVVLLSAGRVVADGEARHVLAPDHLRVAFGHPVEVVDLGPLGLQVVPGRLEEPGQEDGA